MPALPRSSAAGPAIAGIGGTFGNAWLDDHAGQFWNLRRRLRIDRDPRSMACVMANALARS
jgi:hypothetical protein